MMIKFLIDSLQKLFDSNYSMFDLLINILYFYFIIRKEWKKFWLVFVLGIIVNTLASLLLY